MAQLTARSSAETLTATVEDELLSRLGWSRLPTDLGELRPLERGMLMLALQEGSDEEYPIELFESLRTIDDCVYYANVKRGRR